MSDKPRIVHSDPEIMGGTPVFVGTRVPVDSLFDWLEGGYTLDFFLENFPSVSRKQAIAALQLSKEAPWTVRVLLDENVPSILTRVLVGHTVTTVQRMRWSGLRNGVLLARAAAEFDVFITVDRSIEFQQNLPESLIMMTLRVPNNRPESIERLGPKILEALRSATTGQNMRIEADAE